MGLPFTISAGLTSAVILMSESRGSHDHILQSQIRDSPQPGGPGPHIYVPQEQDGPVILPHTGSVFVASCNSQGYDEGIPPRLHAG